MAQTLKNNGTPNKTIADTTEPTAWVGWIYFAAILMMLAGIFQMIAGLIAIFQQTVFVVATESLIVFDYTQWGWVHLLVGIILFLSAFGVLRGSMWGRTFGSLLAGLSAIANFILLPVHPVWSIVVIVVDILIIYALTVHGREVHQA